MVGKTNKGAIVALALLLMGVIAGAGCIGEKMFELPAGVDVAEIPELPAPMGGVY